MSTKVFDAEKYYDKYKKENYESPTCAICGKIVYKDDPKDFSYNKRGGCIFIHKKCWEVQ